MAWIGAESYPSLHFEQDEAGAIVHEFSDQGLALYTEDFWQRSAGPATVKWKEDHLVDRWNPLLLTCVLCSHRKANTIHDAIKSVLDQSSPDWHLIIVDSGSLMNELIPYEADPRVKVVVSPHGNMAQGWQYNWAAQEGLALGDLIHHMTDDDILEQGIFEAWLDRARSHPRECAWVGWADRTESQGSGECKIGELRAIDPRHLGGVIDGIQCCVRRDVAQACPWSEDRAVAWHADALWMQSVVAHAPVKILDVKVGRHRHCADSEFTRPGGFRRENQSDNFIK